MKVFYLIGVPGAGKTTLLRALLGDLAAQPYSGKVPHIAYDGGKAAQLGRDRGEGAFGGTDALAMSIQPTVVKWLWSEPYPIIIAEGDRLANDKFFKAVVDIGANLTVAHLDMPPEVAEARRLARGSRQDPTWLQGRETKVKGLAERWASVTLDGTLAPGEIAEQCKRLPVLAPLFS